MKYWFPGFRTGLLIFLTGGYYKENIVLQCPGNSHGLKQVGTGELVVIINYLKK